MDLVQQLPLQSRLNKIDMKARVIKEKTRIERRESIYKLQEFVKFTIPLIVILKPDCYVLSIHGTDPFEKYINMDKVQPDIKLLRVISRVNTGVIFSSPDTIIIRIFYNTSNFKTIEEIKDAFFKSVVYILNENKIDVKQSEHRELSNDIVFINKEGKEKKFCGTLSDIKYGYFSAILTLKLNADKIEGLYKLDSKKFKLRGNVSDITDVVGGLNEIDPTITESIVDDIINRMSISLNWELENSTFSEEEEKHLNK